ncbi:nucleotidyltransferase [Niallia sp. 01092]|uniref:nucleotidyltransferase n=1 Tax=unclassified Niallia TaxID=2837522 RepID=UPI003FD4EFF5
MKAVGVIVEYNPFHNGHYYHIQKAKEQTEADIVIAIMSGPFLQRGEPAIVSKWHRADMALINGVDIVLELPYVFATQHAELFAKGAVSLLHSIKCDYLCFGSEAGNIQAFINTYSLIHEKKAEYNELLLTYLKKGNSYPKAASLSFQSLVKKDKNEYLDLTQPNNILGYQYVKAVLSKSIPMQLHTIARTQASYHDQHFRSDHIASATSIRNELLHNNRNLDNILPFVPAETANLLTDYQLEFGSFHHWENYWSHLKYRLLSISKEDLSEIYEVEEGLENRLLTSVKKAESFNQFLTAVKTKRYTWTRLQRVCLHILTNTKKSDMPKDPEPTYLRLLGSSKAGRSYLNEKKKELLLPLVSKLSAFHNKQIALDTKASSIYSLGVPLSYQQKLDQLEYSQPPIIK